MTQEVDDQENASEEVKELRKKVADIETKIGSMDNQLARLSAQSKLLTTYSNGLIKAGKDANTSDLLEVKTIGRENTTPW